MTPLGERALGALAELAVGIAEAFLSSPDDSDMSDADVKALLRKPVKRARATLKGKEGESE